MYTTSTVAKKTKSKNAEVRYFARKNKIPKLLIQNREVFIFDKTDYHLFLIYKNQYKQKAENEKQLVFSFYKTQRNKKRQGRIDYNFKLQELIRLLRKAGQDGIERPLLKKMLNVSDTVFNRIMERTAYLPIGEDDRIDNRIYWVGN